MKNIIIPKTYIHDVSGPMIFLAGPIRGAPDWHEIAIDLLFSMEPKLTVASPKKWLDERLSQYIVNGEETHFPRQRAWERHYLDIASKSGSILFWLPGEENHDCNKSYGAMTRLEIGQWMVDYRFDKDIRFCIGSDGKFSELHTIEYDLQMEAPDKIIYPSLEETCAEAIRLAYNH